MNLAELFVAIGIKIENLDQLAALETMLRNVTQQARAALAAVNALNGGKGQVQALTPDAHGSGPSNSGKSGLNPNDPKFIGPSPSIALNEARGAELAEKHQKNWIVSIKKLSTELNKLAVAVTATAVAMFVLIGRSVKATLEMSNFATATGVATDRLQQFQRQVAAGGAQSGEALALLDSLQQKQSAISLGEGDLSPFAFFGIDPTQDPATVFDQLRQKIRSLSAEQLAVSRSMAERLGVGRELFAAFRRDANVISSAFILDPKAIEDSQQLNAAWQDLSFRAAQLRNQLVSALAPAFRFVLDAVGKLLKPIAVFVKWLNSGTILAKTMRGVLWTLAIVIGVVAVAVVALAAGVSALAVAMGLASAATTVLGSALWASGIAPVILTITGFVALLVATLVALVLVVDDIITTFRGGESACRGFGEAIADYLITPTVEFIETLWNLMGVLGNFFANLGGKWIDDVSSKIPNWLKNLFGGGDASVAVNPLDSMATAAAMPPSNQPRGIGQNNQTNDISITVDGSSDPKSTGLAVRDELTRSVSNAAYQMPAPSY